MDYNFLVSVNTKGEFVIYVTRGQVKLKGGGVLCTFFHLPDGGLCNFLSHIIGPYKLQFLYPRMYRKQVFQSTT